ncbi:MAG: PDZ domain-containing protein [Pirellulaceae bacterium]|nr:PDZ domain-containing protein [Planctomycetales bacterium]MCA9224231.1 PDZ domain-containing protein [Planctomycetales bacterium]
MRRLSFARHPWLAGAMLALTLAGAISVPQSAWAQRSRQSLYRLNYAAPRNDEVVRRAFREVVAEPSRSMVRVLCDNRSSALGVVVDSTGYVLTKNSQIHGEIQCHLSDNRRLPAEVVAVDADFDVTLLKVDFGDRPLPAIRWNTSTQPTLGAWLATPSLSALPVSVGVVSAQTRRIQSGRGLLGIMMGAGEIGPFVEKVIPGSGAEQAGLRVADVILRVGERQIRTPDALQDAIRDFKPGDRLTLTVQRGDNQMDITAVLRTLNQIQSHGESTVSVDGPISERSTGFPLAMQHDSVLDPADCGGVIVNLSGEAVGLNIARADRVSTYAIPASAVVPLIARLKSGTLAAAGS